MRDLQSFEILSKSDQTLSPTISKPSTIPQDPKTGGGHILKRRLELGLFQRQVAQLVGVDECTVTNWKKHRTDPQLSLIPKIIEFLGYNPFVAEPKTIGEKLIKYRKNWA